MTNAVALRLVHEHGVWVQDADVILASSLDAPGVAFQAALRLSQQQKRMALARRELYYVELGRILWHRERLLKELQSAAVQLELEADGEVEMLLSQATPISLHVVKILDGLRHSMYHQRYLVRNFDYQQLFEVLTPFQGAIMMVSTRMHGCQAVAPLFWQVVPNPPRSFVNPLNDAAVAVCRQSACTKSTANITLPQKLQFDAELATPECHFALPQGGSREGGGVGFCADRSSAFMSLQAASLTCAGWLWDISPCTSQLNKELHFNEQASV